MHSGTIVCTWIVKLLFSSVTCRRCLGTPGRSARISIAAFVCTPGPTVHSVESVVSYHFQEFKAQVPFAA